MTAATETLEERVERTERELAEVRQAIAAVRAELFGDTPPFAPDDSGGFDRDLDAALACFGAGFRHLEAAVAARMAARDESEKENDDA